MVYLLLEVLGHSLHAARRLTLRNVFAACAVLGLLGGFMPFQPAAQRDVRPAFDVLFEEYAAAATYYTVVLCLLFGVWWMTIKRGRVTGQKKMRTAPVVLLLVAPLVLLGVAQTSRLHDAVKSKDLARVMSALKPWKSVNGIDRNGSTPLSLAMDENNLPIAKFLLERGASLDLSLPRRRPVNYLEQAIYRRKPQFVKLFLDHGASLANGKALNFAVRKGDPGMVRMLLDAGAPVNAKASGLTALMVALANRWRKNASSKEIIDLLLQHGADPRARDPKGYTPIDHALSSVDMLQTLVDHGAPVNESERSIPSPLFLAVQSRQPDAVRFLLEHGADPNDRAVQCREDLRCSGLRTALHEAVDSRSGDVRYITELTSMLLRAGANPNVVDRHNRTPLYYAAVRGNLRGAKLLLEAGANPDIGSQGQRPSDLAKQYRYRDWAYILSVYGKKR